jgi:hypothetical protein
VRADGEDEPEPDPDALEISRLKVEPGCPEAAALEEGAVPVE